MCFIAVLYVDHSFVIICGYLNADATEYFLTYKQYIKGVLKLNTAFFNYTFLCINFHKLKALK